MPPTMPACTQETLINVSSFCFEHGVNYADECFHPVTDPAIIGLAVFEFLIAVAGATGNLLTLLAITFAAKHLRQVYTYKLF